MKKAIIILSLMCPFIFGCNRTSNAGYKSDGGVPWNMTDTFKFTPPKWTYKESKIVIMANDHSMAYVDSSFHWDIRGDTIAILNVMIENIERMSRRVVLISSNGDTAYFNSGDTIRYNSCENTQSKYANN